MFLDDNQTEDQTQSQTKIQNTVNDSKVDEPKNDDFIRLDFEVLLCPDFNFQEGQDGDMLVIAAGNPWSSFDEPVVVMKFVERLEKDYIHFKVTIVDDKDMIV